ncbi:uncharacterized protein [Sinocyclocheilus grahami]|uniref:uncharacterized protein n=1 Tax=Sinocyclocheilus grahami TaxID=75366 RepID=UPI0007AD5169|nr:PREDICTED: uncharacterized protein LOC107567980 [Sinocyclocheilus grahami]
MVFKSINNRTPPYLADLLVRDVPSRSLRSSDLALLTVPRTRSRLKGDRAFAAFLGLPTFFPCFLSFLESEMNCYSLVRVPRNTVFLAPVMSVLKINCTITLYGCHRNPRVSWCKLYGDVCTSLNYSNHLRNEWTNITEHEGMTFLVFLNISMEDTGFYRCKEGDMSIGHAINVTVTVPTTVHTPPNDGLQWLWYFVYICSGIVGLVFIVMIVSFLYIFIRQDLQVKGDSSKEKLNKDVYMKRENNLGRNQAQLEELILLWKLQTNVTLNI